MFTPHTEYIRAARRPDGSSGGASRISREDFWRVWHENEPYLLKLCTIWMKGDRSEAREALSGAMMHAIEGSALDHLPEIGNIKAWLVRIVKNHCIDLQRQQSRRIIQTEAFDYLADLVEAVGQAGQEISPETGFVRQENYQQLLHALESLPERLREVMMLRAYQNMPYKEIARHLCITADSARKRAEQGRSLLIQRLRHDALQARGPRSAHDAGINPRTERRAAEEILQRPSQAAYEPTRHAHLREIRLDETRSIEAMAFLDRRPIRLGQRLEAAKRYMERHPGGWTREKELADLLYIVGQLSEAASHYCSVLRRRPEQYAVAESLANCLLEAYRDGEAKDVLYRVEHELPNAELKAHFQAMRAMIEGDSALAMEKWQKAATCSVDWQPYLLQQAIISLRQGDDGQAQTMLEAVLSGGQMDRKAFHLALVCARNQKAEKAYGKLIERGHEEFGSDATMAASWMLWQLKQDDWQIHRAAIRDCIGKFKGQLMGTAMGIHMQAAWSFCNGRKKACRKLVTEFVQGKPNMREALMVAAFWLERLGDDLAAQELKMEHNRLFGSDDKIEPSYLNALWQNL